MVMKNQTVQVMWLEVILVLLPTYLIRFSIAGIPLNLLDVLICGGFAYCVVHYHGVKLGQWKYPMLALAVIAGIAILVSSDTTVALGLYKSYIIEPMLVGAMILTVKPPLQKILQALSLGLLFVALIGLVQYVSGYGIPSPWNDRLGDFRVTSIYDYPNAIGLFAAPILGMLAAWLIHERSKRRWFTVVFLFGLSAVVLSRSDGAVIALAASIVFAVLFTRWKWVMIWLTVIGFGLALLWEPTRQILLFQDTSGQVRLALWQGTLNLLQHHPLFGAGLGGFPQLYEQYKLARHVELLLYPHNIVLDFWVEFGIAGVIWLGFVVGRFFKQLAKQPNDHALVLMTGMVAILVYGLVDVPYFKNDLAIVFWVILTMGTVVWQKQRK